MKVLQIGADAAWYNLQGRPMRRFGVPEGGPFDRESFALSCYLLGATTAMELGPFGGWFEAEESMVVALAGAQRAVTVDGNVVLSNGRFTIGAGSRLLVGSPTQGARSYLCLPLAEPLAVGLLGTPVLRGDRIAVKSTPMPYLEWPTPTSCRVDPAFRVVAGPQASSFDFDQFLSSSFTVSRESNRVGIRLEGSVESPQTTELPSEPQCVGAIQVPPGGEPIIIGPDGPTIGGYPKIAVVINADRDRLGQLMPGETISFQLVSFDEADR